jgi:nucleotide-binding universal stress UspA family protein
MFVINKILVPLDGSPLAEHVLPFVRIIAEGTQAGVQLLTVNDPQVMPSGAPPMQGKDYLEQVRATYLRSLRLVDCCVEAGKPAEMIADREKDQPNCMIAMATHGVVGPRRWFLGSVTSKVVQTATNPLLLVRPVEDRTSTIEQAIKTIIIGLDGSPMAERVLPYASALAKKLNLELILVQVYYIPIASLQTPGKDFPSKFEKQKALVEKEAQGYLEAKARELRDSEIKQITTVVVEGDPASTLINMAEKHDGGMIAMATHGRSGLDRWFLGSVAEKVVHHCGAPVLLFRSA